MAEVLQYVPDGIGNFPARLQDVHVIPVQKYFAVPGGEFIQRAREPYCKTLDGARQHGGIVDFDDQMQMIALDRIVHDAHSEAVLDLAQCLLDGPHATEGPQKAHARQEAERDVHRMPRSERRTAQVRHAWLVPVRLAACILSLATPSR